MSAPKRIPDEIFEELCGFTNKGELETNISQKDFDKKYAWDKINRIRLRNAGDAFLSKVNKKLINFLKKESIVSILDTVEIDSDENETKLKKKEKEKEEKKKKSKFKYLRLLWKHRKALSNLKRTSQRLKNIRRRIRRATRFIVRKILKPGIQKLKVKLQNFKGKLKVFRKLLVEKYKIVKNNVLTAVRRAFRYFRMMFRRASAFFVRVGKAAVGLIPRLVKLITRGFMVVIKAGKAILTFTGDKLSPVGRFLKDKLQKFLSFLRIELRKLANKVKPLFRMLKNIIRKAILPIQKIAKKLGVAMGKGFKKAFQKAIAKKVGKGVLKMIAKRTASIAAGMAANAMPIIGQVVAAAITIANIGLIIWDVYEWYTIGKYIVEAVEFLAKLPAEIQKMLGKVQELKLDEEAAKKLKRMGQQKSKNFYDMRDMDEMLINFDLLEQMYKVSQNPENRQDYLKQHCKVLELAEKVYEGIGPRYNELVSLGLIKSIRLDEISEENSNRLESLGSNIRENFGRFLLYKGLKREPNPLTNPLTSNFFHDTFTPLQLELLLGGRYGEYKLNLMEIWKRIIEGINSNFFILERYIKIVSFEDIFSSEAEINPKSISPNLSYVPKRVDPDIHTYNNRDKTVKPPDVPWKIGAKHVFKGSNRLNIEEIHSIWDKLSEIGNHFSPYENSKEEELNLQTEKGAILNDIAKLVANY